MTASKRKNENIDDVTSQVTKLVIVRDDVKENIDQDPSAYMQTTLERMKRLGEKWEQERVIETGGMKNADEIKQCDAIAHSIREIIDENETDTKIEESMLEQAEDIKSNLLEKIDQAKDLRTKETGAIGELSAQLSRFHEQRQSLLREIDELDNRQRISQEKIAMYQAEASNEMDLIIDVEEDQKRHVPRLKMTISLYASATGIRWDFANPELLSGQVVRQLPALFDVNLSFVHVNFLRSVLTSKLSLILQN